jgi:hypothetical protein
MKKIKGILLHLVKMLIINNSIRKIVLYLLNLMIIAIGESAIHIL